ncbi:MAG TPA: ACP S-malonyltransferase [Thermoleophilaceae bacterium]
MTRTAVLFPGQGSLTPDSPDYARAVVPELVEHATELVGDDPFKLAHERTDHAQPAIFLASMAGWREREVHDVVAMAGHSLGELSALAAAGALDVEDALRLVVLRGRLMQAAAQGNGGGMIALLGGEPDAAEALASEHGLTIANDNAPGQLVLSGPLAGVDAIKRSARGNGFKALQLDVAGAFHSRSVAAAREPFLEALREVRWNAPDVPVISGATVSPFTDPPQQLADALVAPVRWREVMTALFDLGAREFVDVGPGHVLARLVPRNLPELEQHALAH